MIKIVTCEKQSIENSTRNNYGDNPSYYSCAFFFSFVYFILYKSCYQQEKRNGYQQSNYYSNYYFKCVHTFLS